jgi:putative ABC transport system permease protein
MDPPKRGFDLLRLSDYHLGEVDVFALAARSRPAFSWTLGAIALLVLVLACFNSLNLSLARNSARLKEAGVRKTIGARKGQLIAQLLTESFDRRSDLPRPRSRRRRAPRPVLQHP